jgi:tetratricopeptide (TPR) repeat protein
VTDGLPRLVHREVVLLLVLGGAAVAAFLLTRTVAAGNERIRLADAAAWYGIGQQALSSGRTEDGIDALRRAANKDRGNRGYRLALARALAASRQDDAATQVLVGLRDATPEDADVNTELARLEARDGDFDAARRYYQAALNAVWSAEQSDVRRSLRLELIHLLIAHDEKSRALAELLLLSANLPDTAPAQVEAGQLLLAAGDSRRALDRFSRALVLDPGNAHALAGAGESAFANADYARARRYLAEAPLDAPRMSELRELTDLVLANDPMAAHLSADERSRRLLIDVEQASRRVAACLQTMPAASPARAPLEEAQRDAGAFEPSQAARAARESPESIEAGLTLVARLEQRSQLGCAALTPRDRALLLIAQLHGIEER